MRDGDRESSGLDFLPDGVDPNTPAPGFYMTRQCRGGPFVPVRIALKGERDPVTGDLLEDEVLVVVVNGQLAPDPWNTSVWPWCAKNPITRGRYEFMLLDVEHATEHRPDDPKARPYEPVDWRKVPPQFTKPKDTKK